MKMKRLLAFAMAANLLVSSSFMNTGLSKVYAETAAATETSVEEKSEKAEKPEGIVEVPEDKRLKEVDREVNPEELIEVTDGVKSGEDAVQIENKEQVDVLKETEKTSTETIIEEVDRSEVTADLTKKSEFDILNEQTVKDDDMVRVIIVMDGKAVAEANPEAEMTFFNKMKTALMEKKQNSVVSKIEKKVFDKKEKLDIRYHYTWLANAVATEVPFGTIDEIEKISGVEKVVLQQVYSPCKEEEIVPYTIADGGMIGRDETWASGYTGKGMTVAIVDTGLDADHPSFVALPEESLTEDSATKDTVASVLEGMNAFERYEGLTADKVYRSTKVAYGFNYVDRNLDFTHDNDTEGDHGTHVAGIAAANDLGNGEAVGVAPEAQLYVMKVFGQHGGAYTDDIVAALEDSLILGADVVNMSLGSPAGFTSDAEWIDEVYNRVNEGNTILAVAAGNAATSGQGNMWGTNTNLTSNPDNSTVSSPATYANVTSVASVNNVAMKSLYIEVEGQKFAFSEGTKGVNDPISTIAGQELDFAAVGNFGQTAEDFAAADVAGKVAVVQRGLSSFSDKITLAQQAGAIACIVYNNNTSDFGMDLTGCEAIIPSASITMAAGEFMVAAKAENPELKLVVSTEEALIKTENGYQMSDFSSWGISPDLRMEPDITAPGGNIYSTLDDGKYGLMSGTSMASPNLAGIAALVMQYTEKTYPDMTPSEMHNFVNALLLSTAEPLVYVNNGVTYSPRNQGAGLANAYNAINSRAYLSVDGNDMPKIELLDDPEKTGNYDYTFHVNNFGDKDLYYSVDTNVQTEDVLAIEDYKFMGMTPVALDAVANESGEGFIYTYDYNENKAVNSADARALYLKVENDEAAATNEFFRYDLDNDEDADYDDVQAYLDALVGKDVDVDLKDQVVKVPAGETADVNVNVAVSEAGKEYMDANFENGIYVEGYTVLTAENGEGIDLSIPYMGFYGDWTKAPLLDNGFYWQSNEEMEASQYPHILFTQFGEQDWVPGMNPYLEEEFDINNVSLSPNGDGYADYIMEIYLSLMRNAATLSFTYADAVTGEVYFEQVAEHINKTFYMPNYGQIVPYVYSWDNENYDLTDEAGNPLPNNTKMNLTIHGTVDYDVHESNNEFDTWEVPITIDTEAPTVNVEKSAVVKDEATGKYYLNLTFKDNVNVAGINITNKSGTQLLAQYPSDEMTAGEEITMQFDITGFGSQFMVVLGDYALNESTYKFTAEGNDPVVDETQLYGYRVFDERYNDDRLFGWVSLAKEDAAMTVYSSEWYMDYALTAAEYVGGYIVGVDANNDLVSIRPGYWDERTKITSLGKKIAELAFNPVDQKLYGFNKTDWSIETIDVTTGAMEKVSTGWITSFKAMTFDNEGNLYILDDAGNLKAFDWETGKVGEEVLLNTVDFTGKKPSSYGQSMTFDAEEEVIYWAGFFGTAMTGTSEVLYRIDVKNGFKMTEVSPVEGNAQIVGLIKLDGRGFELPKDAALEGIATEQEGIALLTGTQEALIPVITPWYAPAGTLTWTSADEAVATVDEEGVVTGVAEGETVVTVSAMDGAFEAECHVTVVNPQGTLNGFVMSGNTLMNQWVTADLTALKDYKVLTEGDFVSYSAGEYVDGTIYAYNLSSEFYHIDAETKEAKKIADANKSYQVADMSYDYSTGYMYAIAQNMLDGMVYLVHVDMNTGALEQVGPAVDYYGSPACAMAVSTDGTIYMISYTGLLNKYNPETGELEKIGMTGYTGSQMLQSMAYDHNTDSLYWAMISGMNQVAFNYVDMTSGKALALGSIDGGVQMTSMYFVPENVPEREEVPVRDVQMLTDSLAVLKDSEKVIPVDVQPFNATDRNVTWTVDNPAIAEIKDGIVLGKEIGKTTATGTLAGFEVTFEINVVPSAGELRGYVMTDIATGAGQFWGAFDDRDLSSGEGIASGDSYLFTAGEYYNGKVYGYGFDNATYASQFMVLDGTDLTLEKAVVGDYPDMRDMAFDYSEGSMYAIGGIRNADGNSLYAIDLETGKPYAIGKIDPMIFGLACSTDGILYAVDEEGILYTVDKSTAELTMIGETGYYANQYESMAYDHNTGNLYWAQVYNDMWNWSLSASLLLVNTEDASTIEIGQVGMAGCQITGLHIIPKEEIEVGTPEVSAIVLSSTSEMMKPGDSVTLSAQAFPISVNLKGVEVSYASTNADVATVDAKGNITAVAAGKAQIVASCGNVQAECTVNVVDENTKIQVVNRNGWEVSPLLDPNKIDETVKFPEGMSVIAATLGNDGYYYAIGTDGYLWKYSKDLSVADKIGEASISDQFDNVDEFNQELSELYLVDIATAPESGKVYVLGGGVCGEDEWSYHVEYYTYELNLETGAATKTGVVPIDIDRPVAMTFMDEETLAVYDGYDSYMYSMDLHAEEGDKATSLSWTQNVVTAGETMGMTYSRELDLIFLATADDYNNKARMALYVMNPETGSIAKIANAAYNPGMVDLIIAE